MSEVRVKEGESLENALRRFKRKTARDGILAEARKREHYAGLLVMLSFPGGSQEKRALREAQRKA